MRHALKLAVWLLLAAAPGATSLAAEPEQAVPIEPALEQVEAEPQQLGNDELAALSGGAGIEASLYASQQVTANHTGNTITAGALTSGDVAFSDGALSGFSGIGNFVINTGANNALQGAISVNIVNAPSP